MANSLSNLVNNLSEGIHRIKCKFGHNNKKYETCRTKQKYCNSFLEYTNFKDDQLDRIVSVVTKIINASFMKY